MCVHVVSDPVLGQQAAAELLKPVVSESTPSTTEYFSEEGLFSSLEHTDTQTQIHKYAIMLNEVVHTNHFSHNNKQNTVTYEQ